MPSYIPYNKEARNTGEFKLLFSCLHTFLIIRKPGIQEIKESFRVKVRKPVWFRVSGLSLNT
jgi:hypothetical protein